MAKNMQPIAKRCKALGISPAAMGYAKKTTERNPGGQMRKKKSEYALQLQEKQKVKFVYGIMEKQFHAYYEKAARMPGKTGDKLLSLLERRLDNVVYRLGFAMTRREARQLVSHAHFTVNGKKVDIPSYLVKVRRCDRGQGVQPFLREVQAPAGRGRPRRPGAPVAGAGEERPEGHRDPPARPGGHRRCPSRSISSLSCTPSNRRIPSIIIRTEFPAGAAMAPP